MNMKWVFQFGYSNISVGLTVLFTFGFYTSCEPYKEGFNQRQGATQSSSNGQTRTVETKSTKTYPTIAPDFISFVYGFKDGDWQKGKWKDLLDVANVVEGRTKNAQIVKELRKRDAVFCYNIFFRRRLVENTQQVYEIFESPFKNDLNGDLPGGFDAVCIDEVNTNVENTDPMSPIVINALKRLRTNYPDKGIYLSAVWTVAEYAKPPGPKVPSRFSNLFEAIVDNGIILVLENYHREDNLRLRLFREYVENLDAANPKILDQTIFALGIAQKETASKMDTLENIEFRDHLQKQVDELLRNEAYQTFYDRMPGLGFWVFYLAKPNIQNALDEIFISFEKNYL